MSEQSKYEQGKQELWSATRSVLSSYRKGPRMQKVPRDGALPLSFAQQRVWFLEQLDPLNSVNNIPIGFRLIGSLNQAVLEQSIAEIVRRHEVLRTTVQTVDGQAVQIISPHLTLTLPVIDLRELSHTQREAEVQRQATEEAGEPFDLTERSLFRVKLLRLDEEEHVLFLNMHHIISDGWSLMVFFQELTTLYEAFSNSQPSPLVELPIQYADFAVWQRQWLQGEVLSQLSYWKQQLGGSLPLSLLPTEGPRPPIQTYRGAMQFLELPENLALLLKSLSKREGVTLFMTLLAAFQTLLYRYTGQEDIIVGSPVAGRNQVQTKRLIGLFINTLVMRTNLGGNPTFLELLGRVKEVAIGAYAHQDLPFEKLVEELLLERSLSHTPLFQVMFVFQNALIQTFKFPGLTLTPLEIHSGTARFDLTLEIQETSDSIKGWFEYNTDLFEAATIARMAGHFQTLLLGIVAHPEQRLWELPMLTAAERHQLLVEWNDTHTEYPQDKCIHELFEAQVELTPDAVAVVFDLQQLSYQELNRRANQLAHYLQARGVGPEVLVGICVDRSSEMVLGLLGILKAGGAYVPLDPSYPQERLAFMLNDSQMSVLLTTEKLVARLPEHGAQVVCLDTNWGLTLTESAENPVSGLQPSNLAYVIYTSGSTGKPKAVMVPHYSLVNFTLSAQVEYQMSKSDRVLQFASISFDVAAEEIFLCLSCGGILVLRSDDMLNSVPEFVHKCSLLEVTVLDLPTAYWNQIISELANDTNLMLPPSLRLVIIGGEQALPDLVKMWHKCVGEYPQLLNVYGPTEATVATTVCKLSGLGSVEQVLQQVPIGRPIHNVQVYVLDQYLQPVPIGVPGELYIGGAGLARGYLHRPDLTQEKFIPNPFLKSDELGVRSDELEEDCSILNSKFKIQNYSLARLYKTGDLVCYRTDGQLEFLGRIDDQVKIRGFRIELGEIETVLNQHPQLQLAVVICREDIPGDQRLVAYIVPKPEQVPHQGLLRHFLKQKLPEYMIPSAFVIMESLPLTPNDKVDRLALRAPNTSNLALSADLVPPRTPTEEVLVAIWTEVLGLERLGIYNNFFELGGHSLLATQVISRLRHAFSIELPLRSLFEAPTVAGLAEQIETIHGQVRDVQDLPIRSVSRDRNLPLSFAQARLWFLDLLKSGSATYNMPTALRLTGPLHIPPLERAVQEIVRRHEVLRTNFVMVNGIPMQVIEPTPNVNLPVVDLQTLPPVEKSIVAQRLAAEEANKPFDLSNDRLLRVTLLRLGEEEYVLLVTIHHIVFDGWSMGIFNRELSTLYEAFACREDVYNVSTLLPLPIQYADFAHWQRQWLNLVLSTQLNYWKQQLAGIPPLLELPTDRPRPAVQSGRGGIQCFQLDADLTQKLLRLSQKSGVTLFMTLLAAFVTLLSRYSNQSDIVVGFPIANRNRSEIESLIGLFVNTLVLRIQLQENPSFSNLLTQVRQMALDAYAHQDLPFEKLVEELQPERSLSYSPLFQVMFAFENASFGKLELSRLTLTPLELENVTSKFDLTLSIEETEQGLRGSWEYNWDLFDATTITRMAGHFQTLLEGIVANPEQHLTELPLLTTAQQHQLLVEWNDTHTEYPQDKCIHELFEAQVELTPDAVAVVFDLQQLSYQELNRRANQLAHYLQARGVGPEVLVGICVDRSTEMVLGLLGILKAGGAYVPLDPSYPQERLKFMLQDAQIPVLLTQEKFVKDFQDFSNPIIFLDNHWEIIAQESEENLVCSVKADNLAYVIYTSGSTGEPKGVAVVHRAVNRLVCNTNYVKLASSDKIAQAANTSFDAATFEIWGALLNGAQLVVISRNVTLSPHEFALQLQQKGISVLFLTTALFQQIARDVPQAFASLRYLLFGGETVDPRWVQEVLKNGSRSQLLHVYGPTESTTFSSYYCVQELPESATSIPIGRPITNTQIYLLDAHLQPVPIGVVGELYIGGDGLARGYFNRPELTAQKFIPNPLLKSDEFKVMSYELEENSSIQNSKLRTQNSKLSRLYKTGDLARYLPNGNIQFLGRVDNQVKIRGNRIELGEIESVLTQHPDVKETVVIAREDYPGNKRLVAYVVPKQEKQEHTATINALLRFLKQKLPEYMMPSTFLLLDALPLTANGKIDRLALPVPSRTQLKENSEIVAPRTLTEEMLARIWAEILGIESFHRGSSEINIYDNFFELGGHSLVATLLLTRIRQVFQVDLPLWRLFESNTIAGLAARIETERQTNILRHQTEPKSWSSLVAIQLGGAKKPFFLVAGGNNGGESELIIYAKLVYNLGQEQPVYGLKARGWDPKQKPHTRVEVMASDYIKEIRTIQPEGPYLLGGECIGGVVAFEMARQLQAQGQKVGLLVLMDTQLPSHIQQIGYFLQRIIFKVRRLGRIRYHLTKLLQLNSAELLPYTFDKIQKTKDQLVEQNYATVLMRYRPRTYNGRITLLVNEDYYQENPSMGWDHVATVGLEIHKIPGNHDSYLGEYVKTTAEKLKACLDAVQVDDWSFNHPKEI